jgi:hypothetical protein
MKNSIFSNFVTQALQSTPLMRNQTTKRNIFYKNINNNYKLIPFNLRINKTGEMKYFPAASKEWINSIYFFNSNHLKNFPVYDTRINKLIKGYFNLFLNLKEIYRKIKSPKSRRKSVKRIFVSNAEIQHTASKAIITIYVFDKQRKTLLRKMRKIFKRASFPMIFIINRFLNDKVYKELSTSHKYKILRLVFLKKLKIFFKLYLNWYKFHEKFLSKLSLLISRFYGKKVEFKIIKLKNLMYNPDIFTEILTMKIKKNKGNVWRYMNFFIGKTKLPDIKIKKIKKRMPKVVNFSLIENKYTNLGLNYLMDNKAKNLDKILLEELSESTANHPLIQSNTNEEQVTNVHVSQSTNTKKNYTLIKNIIFNSIKYKNMGGIRLEASGRLTKRYRADRAVFKLRRKGGLKNLDSSYKRLSTVIFKGYQNCNVQYSIRTSKRRIGAFAIKGWISGK